MTPPAEQIFNNRYRVDGTLGTGGMALVYHGTDTLLRRRVAIKVLRDQYAGDGDFVQRFSYEAQSAAKLSHPNIVSVYDFGTEDGRYYIVMELVGGTTLGDLLHSDGKLPEPVAVDYAIQIASGLAYAHRQGLLHRDVKPANILVTSDDVVKISDFGIARAVSENAASVTQPGMVMGSVAYISPEQAQGKDLDERSDLYSLGVVLYQMLTGVLPFTGETPVAVALKHVGEPAPPIDPSVGVSPAVAGIVARLLQKEPSARFSSATEVASALREARERPNAVAYDFSDAPTTRFAAVAPPPRTSAAPDRSAAEAASVETVHTERGSRLDPRLIALPLLLLLAIAVGFFALRGPIAPPARTITLPDLAATSATRAQERLLNLGLQSSLKTQESETVAQGRVISQDPAAGAKLSRGDVVTLVVSGGLPHVSVPDVKTYAVADAQRRLGEAKLRAVVNGVYDEKTPAGQVIDVSPAVGTSLREGSSVTLTVSKGQKPITVPAIVGRNVDDARAALARLGLTLDVQQRTPSDTIPQNAVASQDPAPGTAVNAQSSVSVVVSTGAQNTNVPDVAGQSPDDAKRALTGAGFTPVLSYSVDPANAPGTVSAQQPAGNAQAKRGSKVTIMVNVPGTVPDVTGLTLDRAKAALMQSGYQVGNIVYTADAGVPDGQVVRTEPEANAQLRPGESVNLTVQRAGGQ